MAIKRNFWDILAWIAFGIVILYFLLKVLGIIQSPVTLDLAALLSGAYFVGKYAQKIDFVSKDVESIKEDVMELNRKCPIFKKKGTRTR